MQIQEKEKKRKIEIQKVRKKDRATEGKKTEKIPVKQREIQTVRETEEKKVEKKEKKTESERDR